MARIGKIARLPREVREELNNRLYDGESGVALVEWLNSRTEVQEMMAREFEGQPVNEQNLSAWRRGGYEVWLRRVEAMDLARDMAENADEMAALPGSDKLLDHLSTLMAIELTRQLRAASAIEDEELRCKTVLRIARELSKLRRDDLAAKRMKLEQEKWEAEQKKEAKQQKEAKEPPLRPKSNNPRADRSESDTTMEAKERGDWG